MVDRRHGKRMAACHVSVLALSSRFDGRLLKDRCHAAEAVSVLALSSRFDGHPQVYAVHLLSSRFSTRSVESF